MPANRQFSTVLHKRSNIAGVTPALTSLSAGELAINEYDGKLFIKSVDNQIKSFSNDSKQPFVLNLSLSGAIPQYGNNTITQNYANVLGGLNNDVSGGGSTTVNGEDNDIAGDYAFIGSGVKNKITASGDYSAILGGRNNLINHQNSFTIGSNLSSHAENFTYVNNLSAAGKIYGDGSSLTGIVAGDTEATTLVRTNSANWESSYTTVQSNSADWNYQGNDLKALSADWQTAYTLVQSNSAAWAIDTQVIDASNIVSGTLDAARLPAFEGDITTTVNGSVSATVVAIQGEPISTQTPNIGQVLQWTGTAWTPGAITTGGSGGGGLVYYLNFGNQAQAPTTNLPSTPHTPRELGAEGTIASSSVTKNNVSTTGYDLICGFVSLTGSPGSVTIPAGLWDFNIWASATSTTTKQTSLLLNVYKYDGSNIPTLLASSGDIFIYDPITTAQYIASVVFPQTTLLETDRIYIELTAKATQNNKNITIYFGGTTPTHVHTTFPSVRGSGLVKVINGVYQSPASLLVNTDVAANAAIDQSKINGLTDVANKANSAYTTTQSNSSNWQSVYSTVQTNSATAWNYQGTDLKQLSGNWQSTYTIVQTNSADWNTIKSVPPLHKLTHASGGTDALTPSDIGAIGKNSSDSKPVNNIRALTSSEYDALGPPDPNTIYFIL
jgi:hypothetical protein